MMNMTVEHAKMKAQGLSNSLAKHFSSQMKGERREDPS
jgi:hypothetical protein